MRDGTRYVGVEREEIHEVWRDPLGGVEVYRDGHSSKKESDVTPDQGTGTEGWSTPKVRVRHGRVDSDKSLTKRRSLVVDVRVSVRSPCTRGSRTT